MGPSVGIRLDARRKQSLHGQIFDQIVARIEARAFPAGYKLPPTRVLARELSTHRNTVARAYRELETAGFVSSTVGRGTFVAIQSAAPSNPAAKRDSPIASRDAPEMPWSSLLSHAARAEALGRAERYGLRANPADAINLARMQPSADLIPHELLRRCIANALAAQGLRALSYAPPEGASRLREQIARDLVARGVPARADEVIVTSGSQQGLDLIARALLNPGDTVLVESTTYAGAIDLFTLAGARLVPVPADVAGPDPAALERLARPEVKALYLMPNAHNPSGRTLGEARRRSLVAWSRASGIPIIEDDYAAGLVLEERETAPHLRALDGDVLHVSTFSKRLAPGLRVGYVIAPGRLRPILISMKRVIDLGTSLVLQHALAQFMERGYLRAHMARVQHEYRVRRDALDAALRKALPRGVSWHVPTHGVVLWLRLPAGVDPHAVYEEAWRRGVTISQSALWSVGSEAEPALRLCFCAEPSERLIEGAQRLGKALKHVLAKAPNGNAPARADAADADRVLETV